MLLLLMLLRKPRSRMIYASSQTVLPATLDYYLLLPPGVITSLAVKAVVSDGRLKNRRAQSFAVPDPSSWSRR